MVSFTLNIPQSKKNKDYEKVVECREKCEAANPSTLKLLYDKHTFYYGNPDFKLDLSNFNEPVKISGFYRIHGVNYQNPQTLLMISSIAKNEILHTMVVEGIHELKKSVVLGYEDADKDNLIDGLKSIIGDKEYYNSRCDNLDGVITCKPLIHKGIKVPTQFHVCGNIPSRENEYSKVAELSTDIHLLNISPLTHIMDKKYESKADIVDHESLESTAVLNLYGAADQVFHRVEIPLAAETVVSGNVISFEPAIDNLCTYFA